ncbi:MAG: class I SAM-dependent methyltransferase [Patescibacteria group bacterium]
MKRKRFAGKGQDFWNKEYKTGTHLAISTNPSEDLQKFARWLEREHGREFLNQTSTVLDLGCGNGRNLIFLAQNYGLKGLGLDISREAVEQAKKLSTDLNLEYKVGSISDVLPVPDRSQSFVLDMMTSHFLNQEQRKKLISEIDRVLRPGGWLFLKTFLRDDDVNAERLLKENPAEEKGSYIHPKIGQAEHVFTEAEIEASLSEFFTIEKVTKSHGHLRQGHAFKRRSISVYAQKKIN